MEKTESGEFIDRKLDLFKRMQAKNIRILSIVNLITILNFVGVTIGKEKLLTLENELLVAFDFFITILFGSEIFKLHREREYLKMVSTSIKSDEGFTISETEGSFNNNLEKRAKQYFKIRKSKTNINFY